MQVVIDGGKPIKIWSVDTETGALEQATNLSRLPFVISHVALMPDAHQGYGMPVGGVLFADKAVVPYAIGVDIGCGVTLIDLRITLEDDTDQTRRFLDQVARNVPVGNGPQAEHQPDAHGASYDWLPSDTFVDERLTKVLAYAERQMGTLGGGNHFLELQRDPDGRGFFMIHSGSRSVGKKICDHWHKEALRLNRLWRSELPDDELAWLPWETDQARGYWNDMKIGLAWAEANRARMAREVILAAGRVLGAVDAEVVVDVHHNYAAWESHRGRNGIVHRKGAVSAREDEVVLIPGSMGTASYVAVGLGNEESFTTCQHGAGRARSRGATRKITNLAALEAELASVNVTLITPKREDVIDEAPVAYKDIEEVMSASADLVRPTLRLLPVGVIKG